MHLWARPYRGVLRLFFVVDQHRAVGDMRRAVYPVAQVLIDPGDGLWSCLLGSFLVLEEANDGEGVFAGVHHGKGDEPRYLADDGHHVGLDLPGGLDDFAWLEFAAADVCVHNCVPFPHPKTNIYWVMWRVPFTRHPRQSTLISKVSRVGAAVSIGAILAICS